MEGRRALKILPMTDQSQGTKKYSACYNENDPIIYLKPTKTSTHESFIQLSPEMELSEIQDVLERHVRSVGFPISIFFEIEEKKKKTTKAPKKDKHDRELTHFAGPAAIGVPGQTLLGTLPAQQIMAAAQPSVDAAKLENEIRGTIGTLYRQVSALARFVVQQPVTTAPPPAAQPPAVTDGSVLPPNIRAAIEEIMISGRHASPSPRRRRHESVSSSSSSSERSDDSDDSKGKNK